MSAGQGRHPDPLDPNTPPPDIDAWPRHWKEAARGPFMQVYRAALMLPGKGLRESVIDDLSTYYGVSAEDVLRRCLEWEQWSVEEWHAKERSDVSSITDFFRTTQSWAYDLLWYSYLQAECVRVPVSVAIAHASTRLSRGRRHLDFGSGIGATAQLFIRLGYESDLADVSATLLEFAKYRLERRGDRANYIDLCATELPANEYDVITAIDTLTHVPDMAETAAVLHRALRPGGVLHANFDVRPPAPENAWHLYADDVPLRWELQRAGFEPLERLDGFSTTYRRVEPSGAAHALRGLRDAAIVRSPLRRMYRSVRDRTREVAQRVAQKGVS